MRSATQQETGLLFVGCLSAEAALGLDDELWSRRCGNTRFGSEAVDVYLEKRGALGLQVEITPTLLRVMNRLI